jgi:hypothetical protein
MVGSGSAGGTLIFYTQTKHASTNPNPNGLTERLRIDDNGTTKVTGAFTATSTVTGNSFVKSGGTSAQFLKADGSVDSNTYLTSYTDKKVRQSDTTTDKYRPITLGATTSSTAGSGLNADVTGEVYVNNKIYAQPSSGGLFAGTLTSAGITTLTGTTAESAQIKFSRSGYNYITFPSGGYLAFATSASGAGIVAAVSSSGVSPYTTNVMTLGTSSLKWKEVYATKFVGELDGNAKSDSDGNVIKDTYLKLSGGIMTGEITTPCVNTATIYLYNEDESYGKGSKIVFGDLVNNGNGDLENHYDHRVCIEEIPDDSLRFKADTSLIFTPICPAGIPTYLSISSPKVSVYKLIFPVFGSSVLKTGI